MIGPQGVMVLMGFQKKDVIATAEWWSSGWCSSSRGFQKKDVFATAEWRGSGW